MIETWLKRLVLLIVVVFILFFIFTNPDGAGSFVRNAASAVGTGANALFTFFQSLSGKG